MARHELPKVSRDLIAFTVAVQKVKTGSVSDANIQLTRDDCLALIWGMQLLREGDASVRST